MNRHSIPTRFQPRRVLSMLAVAAIAGTAISVAPAVAGTTLAGNLNVGQQLTAGTAMSGVRIGLSQTNRTYGDPNATVANFVVVSNNGSVPEGVLHIRDNGRAIGAATVSGGRASYRLPTTLAVGQHSIYAVFIPASTAWRGSSSAAVTLTVQRAQSKLTFQLPTTLNLGSGFVAPVTVTAPGVTPSGNIVLYTAGKAVYRTRLAADGTAKVIVPPSIPLGRNDFKIVYQGNAQVMSSWAAQATIVNKRTTSVSASINTTSAKVVVRGSMWMPTGMVAVRIDGRMVARGALVNGAITLNYARPGVGKHQITVTYEGDSRFAGSSSGTTVIVAQDSRCSVTARACVDLTNDRSWIQENGRIIYGPVKITSGRPGYRTNPGLFSIYWRNIDHKSSIFNNAPMPYSQFFDGGIAFHEGSIWVTSHGCIHLSWEAARAYWNLLDYGDVVHVFGYAPY